MKTKITLATVLIVLLTTVLGFSQAVQTVRANVPFPFVVTGKTLPAGEYDFTRNVMGSVIKVSPVNIKQGPALEALVLTRTAGAIHTTPGDSHIVFDKIGNTCYLSELWIPGMDGFVLYVTNMKHEHRSVNVPS